MEDIESDKERADTENDNEKDIGTTIPTYPPNEGIRVWRET